MPVVMEGTVLMTVLSNQSGAWTCRVAPQQTFRMLQSRWDNVRMQRPLIEPLLRFKQLTQCDRDNWRCTYSSLRTPRPWKDRKCHWLCRNNWNVLLRLFNNSLESQVLLIGVSVCCEGTQSSPSTSILCTFRYRFRFVSHKCKGFNYNWKNGHKEVQ